MPAARRLSLSVALGFAAVAVCPEVRADEPPAPSSVNVAAARRHFDKARAFYEQGAYREAIGELDAAHALDPSAKDLVFNLGVVHEKLGDIEDALQWFRLYSGMKLTAQESDRAEAYVRRLEGAKHEVEQGKAHRSAEPEAPPAAAPVPPPALAPVPVAAPVAEPRAAPPRPRFDALTLAVGGVAAAGLIVGVTLGIKAVADQPGSDFVTGRDGSYSDLAQRVDSAHAEAVAADVAFGIAAAAGLTFAYLYWVRPRSGTTVGSATVSAAPLPGGGALLLGGAL